MSNASEDNNRDPGAREAATSIATRAIPSRGNTLDSRDLFTDGREVIIIHGAENYRLRLTSQNKLILTK